MRAPRSAKASGTAFGYTKSHTSYLEILNDGTPNYFIPKHSSADKQAALYRAKAGESKIYAAWVGQWSTDMFLVDDLEAFAAAFGLEYDDVAPDEDYVAVEKVDWSKIDCAFSWEVTGDAPDANAGYIAYLKGKRGKDIERKLADMVYVNIRLEFTEGAVPTSITLYEFDAYVCKHLGWRIESGIGVKTGESDSVISIVVRKSSVKNEKGSHYLKATE